MEELPPTVIGLVASRVAHYPDRPFISSVRPNGIETWTYLEGGRKIAGIADWLTAYGLRKGDCIVAYLDLGDPGVWFYYACAAVGVIPVPLGPSYSIEAVSQLAKQCRAKAIFTLAHDVAKVLPLGLPVLCFGPGVPAGAIAIGEHAPRDPIARLGELAAGITGDDIYMFQPTSGSTGVPKLVMRRNITFPRAGKVVSAGLTHHDGGQAGLLACALTHGSGQYCINVLPYLGGKLCIPSGIDTGIALEEVERLDPTYLYVVPRVLRSLFNQHAEKAKALGADPRDVVFCTPKLQWITIGGAPPDESLLVELERRGVQVVEGYGATEISVIAMTVRGKRRSGSVGRLLDDIIVRTSDEGEVQVKGAFGMAGYFENPEQTREAYTADGYYRTGDLGVIDAEGFLRINGRLKDVFNSAEGSNIFPTRIEEMLEGLPSVAQAILVGDAKPFITALIAVKPAARGALLAPADHAALYAAVRAEIETINAKLEPFERVRRIALFGEPFSTKVYTPVGHAKVRRDRKQIKTDFGELIDLLYAQASPYA